MSRTTLNVLGVALACLYALLAPVMIQNGLEPLLPGRFGRMQLADLLAPAMAAWLAWDWRSRPPRLAPEARFPVALLLLAAAAYVAAGPASGYLADGRLPIADTLKRFYLALTLVFYVRVLRIENAPLIVLWATIYWLVLVAALALGFYGAHLVTGEANLFVRPGGVFLMEFGPGQLVGPMRPTEKLFATYLLLLAAALAFGRSQFDRLTWRLLWALLAVCSLLTFCRPGILAVLFLCLAAVPRAWRWHAAALVAGLTAVLLASAVFDLNYLLGAGGLRLTEAYYLKRVGLAAWWSAPVLGIGPEHFYDAWQRALAAGLVPATMLGLLPETPDSSYVHLAVETGLIGLLAWFGMLALMLRALWWRAADVPGGRWLIAAWLALFAAALIDLTATNFRFLYVLVPLIAAIPSHRLAVPPSKDL